MFLKKNQKYVIDIVDLSANQHKASFIMSQTKEIFARNGFQMSSAIACVTDNLPVMESMKNLLNLHIFGDEFYELSKKNKHYIELSESDKINYLAIKENIKTIINDKYHFASNNALVKVIKSVVDAIKRLELQDATLADVFKELIYIHLEISKLDILISGFKAVISQKAKKISLV
ncbi:17283_t:CDS:2 [Cetraspora pellucida]|uniref:17283_t:CDS:1 n=1 Tax=Cetraspora pellucida TaxID=1433469 RepID=A0ACA9Q0L4_9GLOM|nr:17283_t:CDS:2 [Cetraspora pellucida]